MRLLVLSLFIAVLAGCASTGGERLSGRDVSQFEQAMAAVEAGDKARGMEMLVELTERSRASAVPFINLAMLQREQGKLEAAGKNLERALQIEPGNPVANNEYGLLLRKMGQFDAARQRYEKTLGQYPEFALARKNLGVLCDIYLRDYPCALEAYQVYSELVPEDDEVEVWITDLQWRVGN